MAEIAKHIFFKGNVQGVGFRYTARTVAQKHELAGFVRNLPDGRVEMLAQGPEKDVERAIAEIESTFSGHIHDRQIEQMPPRQQYSSFHIAF